MAGGVGVLSTESRAKGVDVSHSAVIVLHCQLTRDSEEGRLVKEVLSVVKFAFVEGNHLLLFLFSFLLFLVLRLDSDFTLSSQSFEFSKSSRSLILSSFIFLDSN